jgi:hypothetical protein
MSILCIVCLKKDALFECELSNILAYSGSLVVLIKCIRPFHLQWVQI